MHRAYSAGQIVKIVIHSDFICLLRNADLCFGKSYFKSWFVPAENVDLISHETNSHRLQSTWLESDCSLNYKTNQTNLKCD